MKKIIFLLVTLTIPVLIFLFLKFFGENTFEVSPLFQEGIPNCPNSSRPHVVPDFQYIGETEKNFSSVQLDGYFVFGVLDSERRERNMQLLVELVRIQDAFYEIGSPHFVLFYKSKVPDLTEPGSICDDMGLIKKNRTLAFMKPEELNEFLKCGIALINKHNDPPENLVLVDTGRKVRGIYNGLDIEQTDQLILELKILKQQN